MAEYIRVPIAVAGCACANLNAFILDRVGVPDSVNFVAEPGVERVVVSDRRDGRRRNRRTSCHVVSTSEVNHAVRHDVGLLSARVGDGDSAFLSANML